MTGATKRQRVLSGIQPSGLIHLGNYFGAIQQHMELQHEFPGECLYFIADYHALTTVHDAEALRTHVFDLAATYLAMGLDPDKALLFRQSDVPEVTELTWLLATVTGMGLLERAVSYKDKVTQGLTASVGLFTYPILMAADILAYDSTMVPVGKDQVQHVEMTRDMATHFNEAYGSKRKPALTLPRYRLSHAPYVPGIDGRKMSKSYGNTIWVFRAGKALRKRVGQIVTDSTPMGEPLDPDNSVVFDLFKLFASEAEQAEVAGYFRAGARDGQPFGYGHAKQLLAAKIDAHFADARARYAELQANPERVEDVLRQSAAKARALARATVDRCKRACGLR
ncbi:MAG: tryptophan--tRNA ligase [Myxococcales bacterium]|nr:tryptophan--tRNA ligase [Myxococcales bacterium]